MDTKQFGSFLAQCRKDAGMTQAELAGQLHVTDKAVSRWERGIGYPDIQTIVPLAEALGISVQELMHAERAQHDPERAQEAAALMQAAAEIAKRNLSQERTATALAVAATIVAAVLAYLAGLGNLGGSLFFGAITAAVQVGVYLCAENWDEPGSRWLYAGIAAVAAAVAVGLLLAARLV